MRGACIALCIVASVSLVAGCEEKPTNPVEEYGTTLINTRERAKATADAANLKALKRSISAFRASHGRYPGDLGELAAFSGIEADPELYDYDPGTGTIALTTR